MQAVPRVPALTSGWHGDEFSSSSSISYKPPSYQAAPPSYRPAFPRDQPKSYQPLDMTGKNAFYSSPITSSQVCSR